MSQCPQTNSTASFRSLRCYVSGNVSIRKPGETMPVTATPTIPAPAAQVSGQDNPSRGLTGLVQPEMERGHPARIGAPYEDDTLTSIRGATCCPSVFFARALAAQVCGPCPIKHRFVPPLRNAADLGGLLWRGIRCVEDRRGIRCTSQRSKSEIHAYTRTSQTLATGRVLGGMPD
jgi:hypothetical protein